MKNSNSEEKYLTITELEYEIKSSKFDINNLLKIRGYQNKPLNFDQAYLLGIFALSSYVTQIKHLFDLPIEMREKQSIAALCTFHNKATYEKKGSEEQIAGICAAVFDYDVGTSASGFILPTKEVMDNCGMGGDLCKTPNLSTIAALIASADGIAMVKHGSPGNTDNVGSSDFLAYCGVNLFPEKAMIQNAVQKLNFAYTDALDENYKRIHTQTHRSARLAHMNDIIGPITNPVDPKYMKKRVLGINHLISPEKVALAYKILNEKEVTYVDQGLFIRGFSDINRNGGIDEVSIMSGGTLVAELRSGEVTTYNLFAKDFGLDEITPEQLDPGKNKAQTSRDILQGDSTDGHRDSALANASILFYLSQGLTFKEGVEKASEILTLGKPYELLQDYAKFTTRGDLK